MPDTATAQPRLETAAATAPEHAGAGDADAKGQPPVVRHADEEQQIAEKLNDEKLIWKAFRRARKWRRRLALHQAVLRAFPSLPTITKDKLVDFTTSTGRRVRFRFASFENITTTVNPIIAAQGLVIVFTLKGRKLVGHLLHDAGGRLRSWLKLPKNVEAAEIQSEISKRRRYIEIALLNIAAEDTEDSLPEDADRTRQPRGTRTRGGQRPNPQRASGARGGQRGAPPKPAEPPKRGGTPKPAEPPKAAGPPKPAEPPKPAAATRPAAASSPARRPAAPPPAGSSKPAAGAAATDGQTAEWLYRDTPVSNQLREILPQLTPKQAADLRRKYNADPEAMLREARKLHEHIYGTDAAAEGGASSGGATPEAPAAGAAPKTPQAPPAPAAAKQPAETLTTRIENAFNELDMPDEDRRALRTEYTGREQDLLERLIRTYQRRRDQEAENK